MHSIHRILGITTALAALAGCGGESSDEPRACRDGSCDHQSTNTFCDIDGVYPGTEAPNECIAPPAADACNRAVACDDAAKPYCDDDSMGTCVECTENLHCTTEGESCNPINGQCTTEIVVQCDPDDGGDATCAANNDVGDYCSDVGACADCLVDDHCSANVAEAICGQDLLECRGCEVGGSDCETGLCGTNEEGVCIQPDEVIYVNGGTGVDGGACDEGNPCKTIAGGIEKVEPGRNIILVAAGMYPERLVVSDKNFSLIADGNVSLNPPSGGDTAVLTLSGTADVTLVGIEVTNANGAVDSDAIACSNATAALTLIGSSVISSRDIGIESDNCTLSIQDSEVSGNTGIGISATGGTLEVQDSEVSGNTGIGISATGGTLEVQDSEVSGNTGIGISATGGTLEVLRSEILNNAAGGLVSNGANYTIVNNIIGLNGFASGASVSGADLTAGGATTEVFEFNTVAFNRRGTSNNRMAMQCDSTNLVMRNCIFMLEDDATFSLIDDCNSEFSLIDMDSTGDTGEATSPLSANATFVNAAEGDFHLLEGSPGIDVANGTPPATDIDGDPRTAGMADMGADEFVAN